MSQKSDVFILDNLMKNETSHKDTIEIMSALQDYLREGYQDGRVIVSGGGQLTGEHQTVYQRHVMCGDTPRENCWSQYLKISTL